MSISRRLRACVSSPTEINARGERGPKAWIRYSPGLVGSVIKKRRKKMRKHKHKKMLKKTRWQRRG
jgi:hypothetical protein